MQHCFQPSAQPGPGCKPYQHARRCRGYCEPHAVAGLMSIPDSSDNEDLKQASRQVEEIVREKISQPESINLCLEDNSDWVNATTRLIVLDVCPVPSCAVPRVQSSLPPQMPACFVLCCGVVRSKHPNRPDPCSALKICVCRLTPTQSAQFWCQQSSTHGSVSLRPVLMWRLFYTQLRSSCRAVPCWEAGHSSPQCHRAVLEMMRRARLHRATLTNPKCTKRSCWTSSFRAGAP